MQRKGKIHWTDRQGISFFSSTVEEVWSLSNVSLSLSLRVSIFFYPSFPSKFQHSLNRTKPYQLPQKTSFSHPSTLSLSPLLRSQKKRTKCGKNSPVNHPLENLSKLLKLIYNMPMRCKAYNFIHFLTPMLILISVIGKEPCFTFLDLCDCLLLFSWGMWARNLPQQR